MLRARLLTYGASWASLNAGLECIPATLCCLECAAKHSAPLTYLSHGLQAR